MLPSCVLAFLLLIGQAVASSAPPWQEGTRRSVVEDSLYADLPPTVFSPSGRLVAVEQVLPTVSQPSDRSNSLVVAIHCRQGAAVVASLPRSPYMYDPRNATNRTAVPNPLWILGEDDAAVEEEEDVDTREEGTGAGMAASPSPPPPRTFAGSVVEVPPAPFCRLGPRIFGVTAGTAVDALVVRSYLHDLADSHRRHAGQAIAASDAAAGRLLARRWADAAHQRTLQDSDRRLLACCLVLVGPNEVWRVDPTGQFYKCRAAVAGRAAAQAERMLLRTLNETAVLSVENATNSSTGQQSQMSGSRVKAAIRELTLEQALVLATKTILGALPKSDDAAVRIVGLSCGDHEDWYTQNRLLELVRNDGCVAADAG